MPDAVCVRIFPTRAEARLARGILEDIDVRSFLLEDVIEGSGQQDRATGRVKLMVAPGDAARARSVLRGAPKF